jgi:hypothetical protein
VDGACRCRAGLVALEGACVGPRQLDAFCGAPSVPGLGGGCPGHACADDEALDLASGACAPRARARAILARIRPIPEDLEVGCKEGRALALRGEYASCLPREELCPRGTEWSGAGKQCLPAAACPPGEVGARGADGGDGCVGVVLREEGGQPVVDVGAWARAVLGEDGGEGRAPLCRALSRAARFDLGPGGARTVSFAIDLVFPGNDLTQLSSRVTAPGDPGGPQDRSAVVAAAMTATGPLLEPLGAFGGLADAASLSLRLRCTVDGGSNPELLPR